MIWKRDDKCLSKACEYVREIIRLTIPVERMALDRAFTGRRRK